MKKVLKSVNDVIAKIIYLILIIIVILNIFPYFFNFEHYVVLSGSMEPEIHVGAMVYVNKNVNIDQIQAGDIIAFQSDSVLVTHRVVDKNVKDKVFITKGDANENVDFAPVLFENYVGKTEFSIPCFGLFMNQVHSVKGMIIIFVIIISQYLINCLLSDEENDTNKNKLYLEKIRGKK